VETVQGDIADVNLPSKLMDMASARHAGLDVIISNAGTSRRGLLVDQDEENWDAVMNVNVRAFWRIARAGRGLLKESGGSLVAVASIAASAPNPGTGFYSASKAALLSLVSQLGLEWALDGIRVNAVSPGVTLTPLNARQYEDASLKARREGLVPLKRFATPDEIASAILFMAGPGAQFCQGYNLVVDGGLLPSVLAHSLPPVGARRTG
jgi:glucose 1-dehydrogenase